MRQEARDIRVGGPAREGRQVVQLRPGAWRFAAGHVAGLERLGRDAPYGRASDGTFEVGVRSLEAAPAGA